MISGVYTPFCKNSLSGALNTFSVSTITQWALEPQIDVKPWSISRHNINKPDFDILLMSNCKYHVDVNI